MNTTVTTGCTAQAVWDAVQHWISDWNNHSDQLELEATGTHSIVTLTAREASGFVLIAFMATPTTPVTFAWDLSQPGNEQMAGLAVFLQAMTAQTPMVSLVA